MKKSSSHQSCTGCLFRSIDLDQFGPERTHQSVLHVVKTGMFLDSLGSKVLDDGGYSATYCRIHCD